MRSWRIYENDVDVKLASVPKNHYAGMLCDPPYGLAFMGNKWDYAVPHVDTWRLVLRALKPGAPILVFGGTRTSHRIVCGLEDAGFEIRDSLMWLYAKGFPKSHNVALALDRAAVMADKTDHSEALSIWESADDFAGYGTALKPAHEPICLARKPLEGTMVQNIRRWGVGPLAIDACRVGAHDSTPEQLASKASTRTSPNAYGKHRGSTEEEMAADIERHVRIMGRWPANLLLDFGAAEYLDATVGPRKSGKSVTRNGGGNRIWGSDGPGAKPDGGYSDSGGPSRFFFSPKVSTKEREAGCDELPHISSAEMVDREESEPALNSPRTGAGRGGGARNHHPTLKPIWLNHYLARLLLPPRPAGPLLVPFSGAGSEVIGALLAGWHYVEGIEREAEYVRIAEARILHWIGATDTNKRSTTHG